MGCTHEHKKSIKKLYQINNDTGKCQNTDNSCKKATFRRQVLFGMYMFLISMQGIRITGNLTMYSNS